AARRGGYPGIPELAERLDQYLNRRFSAADKTRINRLRADILQRCKQSATLPPGLFSLTVPTGGGKTLSSLAFALSHARAHGLQRVIYVIPYTSIIEQNAAVFRKAVGDDCVLEHHSNFQFPDEDDESSLHYRWRLATENWDAP